MPNDGAPSRNYAPGTEFLDAETGRPNRRTKWPLSDSCIPAMTSFGNFRHRRNGRQEREFCDQRPRAEIAALPRTETGIRLSEDEKPRQRRAFLESLQKSRKRQTAWWARQGSNL